MSSVRDILSVKGNAVWSVKPQDAVKETLKLMAEKNVGAVLVVEDKEIAGIFSERDFVRHFAKNSLPSENLPIKDLMTKQIISVTPTQSTDECMAIMTAKHIRHLPVIEDGKLIGLISIGDVVKRIIEDHKFSISQLQSYVTGGMQ